MIQIKRKVRLRQKTVKTALPTQCSSKRWPLIALVVALLLGGGYLWYNSGAKSSEPTQAQAESSVDHSTDPTTTDSTPASAEEQGTTPASRPTTEGATTDAPAQPAPVGNATSQPEPTPSAKPSVPAKSTAKPAIASATPASVASDVEVVAREVIQGRYGNGATRKQQLGVRYSEVQQRVNELYRKGLVN